MFGIEKKLSLFDSKVAILGIQSAGKTSIIKVLTQEFDMLTLLKPTSSIERTSIEIFGNELVFWDFGGQAIYRSKYLATPELNFDMISIVYYVVDIQDEKVLDESKEYFLKVLENIKIYSPKAKIVLLFHKNDPNREVELDRLNIKQHFLDGVVDKIEKSQIPIFIYKTSIYNHLSIITAFSQPFLGSNEVYKTISKILQSFTESYRLGFSVLFTKKYFELGNSLSNRIPVSTRDDLLKYVMKKHPFHEFETKEITELNMGEYIGLKILIGGFGLNVGNGVLPFQIVIGFDEQSVFEEKELTVALEKMIDNLEKILINMDLFTFETHLIH